MTCSCLNFCPNKQHLHMETPRFTHLNSTISEQEYKFRRFDCSLLDKHELPSPSPLISLFHSTKLFLDDCVDECFIMSMIINITAELTCVCIFGICILLFVIPSAKLRIINCDYTSWRSKIRQQRPDK